MTGKEIQELLKREGITPTTVEHRGAARIRLDFAFNDRIATAVKQIPNRRWSKTMQAWHIPKDKALLEQLIDLLGIKNSLPAIVIKTPSELPVKTNTQLSPVKNPSNFVSIKSLQPYIQKLSDKIHLKGYSYSTLKLYRNHFLQYLKAVAPLKPIDDITKEEIEKYLRWRQKQKDYSESDQNIHINAIKFYYEFVLGRSRMLFDLPRPTKPKQLPTVWSEHDVIKLLNAVSNEKHQLMLLMAYAHGLRVSELSSLKLADMDSHRMQIHIKAAKGKKDRIVNLSEGALSLIKEYYQKHRPKIYLFENEISGEPISTRTIQEVFTAAKNKAGLIKKAGIHSLRHSFATHLHEQGIDIKYIKDLLGHNDLRTTERYTHVSRKDISRVKSPFDNLKLK